MMNRKSLLDEARLLLANKKRKTPLIFTFIILLYISQFAISLILSVFTVANNFDILYKISSSGGKTSAEYYEFLTVYQASDAYRILSLFLTVITIAVCIFYCKNYEKRTLSSMGLRRKNAIPYYLLGLVIGFCMFSLVMLINLLTGASFFDGKGQFSLAVIAAYFFGYIIQGSSEELLLRGFFMLSYSSGHGAVSSVLMSSLLFSLLHMGNAGISFIAILNIFLFGIFAGFFMLRCNNIWGICAIHSAWNFTQGNFFGQRVSGASGTSSIFVTGNNRIYSLINGGEFGPEGGLSVTLVLILALGVLCLCTSFKRKRRKNEKDR